MLCAARYIRKAPMPLWLRPMSSMSIVSPTSDGCQIGRLFSTITTSSYPLKQTSQLHMRQMHTTLHTQTSSTQLSSNISQQTKGQSSSPSTSTRSHTNQITSRATNFSQWYHDVIASADLVDSTPVVKGCTILKPAGMSIWDRIRQGLNGRIEAEGAQNTYFPLLIPLSFISKEAAHVAGFAQECAVVTHHRLRSIETTHMNDDGTSTITRGVEPDPTAELTEPYVIRPTSETVIWHAFARWIRTKYDLPLCINQWANVVRWEMRTRPFLRTSEFLWQEGHTAHATAEEANLYAKRMHNVYTSFLRDALAIPVIAGEKSIIERFAGANQTYTCEAMMGNGWALQAATSHDLGQHFSKAFDVGFTETKKDEDINGVTNTLTQRQFTWGTSWGASTRLIGGVIMAHGDDTGLVLPPAIAPTQIVIVPIAPPASKKHKDGSPTSTSEEGPTKAEILAVAQRLAKALSSVDAGAAVDNSPALTSVLSCGGMAPISRLRVQIDTDMDSQPGSRYYHWERKGVPIRLELGARDIRAGVVTLRDRIGALQRMILPLPASILRDTIADPTIDSTTMNNNSNNPINPLTATLVHALTAIQGELLARATILRDTNIIRYATYEDLVKHATMLSSRQEDTTDDIDTNNPSSTSTTHVSSSKTSTVPYTPPAHMFLVPWKEDSENETKIKQATKFTLRCYPIEFQSEMKGLNCFYSARPATHMALFARAY